MSYIYIYIYDIFMPDRLHVIKRRRICIEIAPGLKRKFLVGWVGKPISRTVICNVKCISNVVTWWQDILQIAAI
jgi:hypothetical protein